MKDGVQGSAVGPVTTLSCSVVIVLLLVLVLVSVGVAASHGSPCPVGFELCRFNSGVGTYTPYFSGETFEIPVDVLPRLEYALLSPHQTSPHP